MNPADPTQSALLAAAFSVALLHTLMGVDHYLPFVVLGRARGWGARKVAAITALCGLGHVVGSVLLGVIGIGVGAALGRLEWIESVRGSLAAWGLIAFGLIYMAWALKRGARDHRHVHAHAHSDGTVHSHDHAHHREHLHAHAAHANVKMPRPVGAVAVDMSAAEPIDDGDAGAASGAAMPAVSVTFWSMFIVFALGPCEPLIPVLMAPAFEQNWWLVAGVTMLFATTTIVTMVAMALVGTFGLSFAPIRLVERWGNVAAGAAIACSGLAIQFLGI